LYDHLTENIILAKLFRGPIDLLVNNEFKEKMLKDVPEYLQSHYLRKIIFNEIVDRMLSETCASSIADDS